ncbi:hypothetical protein LLH23_17555 [bacterium]|nr:hypothetical protein [bacterium]
MPDVVAVKSGHVLVVESKPLFSRADYRKLRQIVSNPDQLQQLAALVPVGSSAPEVLPALAFAGALPSQLDPSVVVFHYIAGRVRPLVAQGGSWRESAKLADAWNG